MNLSLSLERESLCDRSHDVLAPAHLYLCGLVFIVRSDSILRVGHILALHREWLIQKDLPRHPVLPFPTRQPGQHSSAGEARSSRDTSGYRSKTLAGDFIAVPYCATPVRPRKRKERTRFLLNERERARSAKTKALINSRL